MPEAIIDPAIGHPALAGIRLVFGGNAFGWTIDRDRSFAMLDAFYEAGGRMIDTAEGYSSWVPGNKGGESEAIIGEWMEARGVRQDMRVATKTGMGGAPGSLRPEKVAAAIEGSLQRLRSDYVDLYYAHRDDPETPLDEVAGAYDALVRAGKARSLGASNFTADRLLAALAAARTTGATPYSVFQPEYNLVWRGEFEGELQLVCHGERIAVLPYYGLASGFLSGKYKRAEDWAGSSRAHALNTFAANGGWAALKEVEAIAAEIGTTPSAVTLAWLNSRPAVVAPLASATSPAQLADLTAGAALVLTDDQLKRLNAIQTA